MFCPVTFYRTLVFFYFKKHPIKQEIRGLKDGIQIKNKKESKIIKWSDINEIDYHSRSGIWRLEAIRIIKNLETNPISIYYPFYNNTSLNF